MIQVKKEPSKEEYQQIVKNLTPKHNSLLNCAKAFVVGGVFCVLGEMMKQTMITYFGLSKKDSLLYVTIELVLLSVILTGFNLYGKITKFGGAGGLVPITGFANSVASAAIEYQKEGQVFGIGVKIFTIAGPVILYGIFVTILMTIKAKSNQQYELIQKQREEEYKKELEKSAREAKKANIAKTEFLQRMSHDIRTPINGIRGMVEVGDYYKDNLVKQAECRKKIWEASGFLLELINEVLDMGKLESEEVILEERSFNFFGLFNCIRQNIHYNSFHM